MKPSKLLRAGFVAALSAVFLARTINAQDADPAPGGAETSESVTNEVPMIGADEETTASAESEEPRRVEPRHGSGDAMVMFGQDAVLKAGKTAEAVVVIGGNAKVDGNVNAAVVAIMGDVELNGEVGDAVVAVLGSIKLGPGAIVHGDAVSVGGTIDAAPDAVISGHTQAVPFHFGGLPEMKWLREYIIQGVFKLRPLPPQVGWAWGVALVVLFFYFLVAAIFPRPVKACVEELSRRPATTFLMGVLTKMLLPLILLLLVATGIGMIVVPFIMAVVALAGIVGKVALLEWVGLRIGAHFGEGFRKPLVAFVIGAVILVVLYMIPILGLLTLFVTSIWALGCAVTATFGGIRREGPQTVPPLAVVPAAVPVTPPYIPPAQSAPLASPGYSGPAGPVAPSQGLGSTTAGFHAGGAASTPATGTETLSAAAVPVNPPVLPEALSYPRAGFWERMGAGFLDVILISIVSSFVGGLPLGLLVALAYFAGMWTWKGSTVGGIVLGLKVVRADGQDVTFAVALVRGLAAAFSIIVVFLGFLWIAWDPEKQGWHDRIAGTVVLRMPKGTPLLAL